MDKNSISGRDVSKFEIDQIEIDQIEKIISKYLLIKINSNKFSQLKREIKDLYSFKKTLINEFYYNLQVGRPLYEEISKYDKKNIIFARDTFKMLSELRDKTSNRFVLVLITSIAWYALNNIKSFSNFLVKNPQPTWFYFIMLFLLSILVCIVIANFLTKSRRYLILSILDHTILMKEKAAKNEILTKTGLVVRMNELDPLI